ncbi:MAG: hypothetical protein ACXVP0_07250 [Bacteroidia bacterium]
MTRVFIKAITNTSTGMIRFFVYDGVNARLIREVMVPANNKASIQPAFETSFMLNYNLKSGYSLKVSTQNADTFNVIADGRDWAYYASGVRMDTTKFTANTGTVLISTANSNLNGTGTIGTAFTAGSSPTYKGARISSITVKGYVNVTPGMVRLYIDDGTMKYCFREIVTPTITKSPTDKAFEQTITFEEPLHLKAGYKIGASTQNAENFHVCVEANDWNYYG